MDMKIVVTAQGKDLDSEVDPRFGRSKWNIIVDTESGSYEALDNARNLDLARGAGIQAAEKVSRLGVEALLTGHCGPNAFRTLSAAGLKVFVGASGTVREAVERFKLGELVPAEGPDREGHWS
jgi:predicted Fe-Mo cluster-binding NifX family protein